MGSFVSKQPNGLYCRFSSIVDTVTHTNMTAEDYIEMCADKARIEAIDVLANYIMPFEEVVERFIPNNQPKKEFEKWLKDIGYEVIR
jgi:hypothetical protein